MQVPNPLNTFLHVNPAQQQHVKEPPQPTEVHVFFLQLWVLARQVVPAVGFVVVGIVVVGKVVVGLLVGVATAGAEVEVGLTVTLELGFEVGFSDVGRDFDGLDVVGFNVDGFGDEALQERTGVFSAAYS